MATVSSPASEAETTTLRRQTVSRLIGSALGVCAAYWAVAAALDLWGSVQNPAVRSMLGADRWLMLLAALVAGVYGWRLTTPDRSLSSAGFRLVAAIGVMTVAVTSFHLISRLISHGSAIISDGAVTEWYLRYGLVLAVVGAYALVNEGRKLR
jgi:hypothetical protein